MIINKSYKIKSCDDVELDLPRSSEKNPKLEFKLCWEDSAEIRALICIIPGLGNDADENYREHLAQFVATQYQAAVLSINYHCIGNRSLTGSDYYLDAIDRLIWEENCKSLRFKMPSSQIYSEQKMIMLLEALNAQILKLKAARKLAPHFHPTLTATIAPARGEHNNFGVMSALDVLNALFFVQKKPPFEIAGGGGVDPALDKF